MQKYCEPSATPSIPIRISSQIAVDCKSVHFYQDILSGFMDRRGAFFGSY